MKKRYLIFIFLILFSIGIFIINAAVYKTKGWHSGNIFKIKIDDTDRTLQYAISNNLFTGSHTYAQPSSTSIPDPGHSAEQIWVSINGNENTLLQALSSANKLCDPSPRTLITSYSSSPTDKSKAYHFANQIEVTVGTSTMSFQEAIDNGKFNPSNFGQSCPSTVDPECINPGTIQCDGTCSGSYKSGTACSTSEGIPGVCNVNTGNCDATGVCVPGSYRTINCDYLDITCRNYNAVTDICKSDGTWTNPPCDLYTNAPRGKNCWIYPEEDPEAFREGLCSGTGNCVDIRDLVPSSLGYKGATVETYTSCKGNVAFYNKDNVKDGDDNTYSKGTTISAWWDSYDPLTCSYDWTVTLPYEAGYIRRIVFATAIDGIPWSGRTRELWLEYYDDSWHSLYDSGAVTNSEGKTGRVFYIPDPSIKKITKVRVRVELKRASKYQTIDHNTYVYSMRMFGIY